MAYAVTHVLLAIILLDIIRDYLVKRKFSTHLVLFGGIAGLLPDIDVPIASVINAIFGTHYNFHRVYTHSLVFVFLFIFIGLIIFLLEKENFKIFGKTIQRRTLYLIFFVLAYGWLIHIGLDCFFAADPNLNLIPGIPLGFCVNWFSSEFLLQTDAILLILWLLHEEWKHKIRDYI